MADPTFTVGQTPYFGWSGAAIKEDVLDVIYQITPEDTPFFNMIGDSRASQPFHSWGNRELNPRVDNARLEGANYVDNSIASFEDPTVPTRVSNITQIVAKLGRVTETAQASTMLGISDLMADAIQVKSTEFKTDIEHVLLRGSLNSGNTGTARRMGGFHNVITSNAFNYSSVSFDENIFNIFFQHLWEDGGKAQDVLCRGYLRRRISSLTDSATKFFMAEDRKVINTIGVYESDFHTTAIHLSRDVGGADTANNRTLYAFDRSFFAKAWLRTPRVNRLPKMGDSTNVEIISELTLEYGNQGAAGQLQNFNG